MEDITIVSISVLLALTMTDPSSYNTLFPRTPSSYEIDTLDRPPHARAHDDSVEGYQTPQKYGLFLSFKLYLIRELDLWSPSRLASLPPLPLLLPL